MKHVSILQTQFCVFLTLINCVCFTFAINCKDERNADLDWFIVYKIPKIANEPKGSLLNSGEAYAYITSKSATRWKLSDVSIDDPTSMLRRTWEDYKNYQAQSNDVSYLFYNDDSPDEEDGTAVGHLKGMVAFDETSGFWLVHSVPRYGEADRLEYPQNAYVNGQMALCITFRTSYLEEICEHLLFCNPKIYASRLSTSVATFLDRKARSIFTKSPEFVRKAPFQHKAVLKSIGGEDFFSFAKDNQLKTDIYSTIVAPGLDSSLIVESWRRGSGTILPSDCRPEYSVVDIASINMTVSQSNAMKSIFFKSTEDHSKWAVSTDASSTWVCVGDLNRMVSQERRGGGALCFQSKSAWKALRNVISEINPCPVK